MFSKLNFINERPQPFSIYTADVLWTNPHLSEQMLRNHLSQDTEMASRRISSVNKAIDWIDDYLTIYNKSICDLGCGPGLYTQKFAERGAKVHGIDFSSKSIQYARNVAEKSGHVISYEISDYLKCSIPSIQDIVVLIYYDMCALSPQQRKIIYTKVHASLRSGGIFMFDVLSKKEFANKKERVYFGYKYMNGFWSAEDYYAFKNSFVYKNENVTLDKYSIVEKENMWSVFNWMQYFDDAEIERELKINGYTNIEIHHHSPLADDIESENNFLVIARA